MSRTPPKQYDRAYFDRWYRGGGDRLRNRIHVGGQAALRRNVALAVSATESILDRPLKSVLDVGCGEGRWQPEIHKLRPKASYLGIDPSEYAIERFGTRRNLRLGGFGELHLHVFERPFDLVVCSDVLHYLDDRTILEGLDTLADLVGGVALLETFTSADDVEGDSEGFYAREPEWYRRAFAGAGLVPIGLQMYVHAEIAEDLDALDIAT